MSPQLNDAVIAICAHCHGEIYEGDETATIAETGELVHDGYRETCAVDFARTAVYYEG